MNVVTAMEWRRCPRFPRYEVSDSGDVRVAQSEFRQPGRVLKGTINFDGYICFSLQRGGDDNRSVAIATHMLVAEAFIGPPPTPNHQVAHNNGSKINNYWRNLRWATPLENRADQVTHFTAVRGMMNGRATITDDDVRYIRKRYREIKLSRGRVDELDEQFGLSRAQIIRIASKDAWPHVIDHNEEQS